MKKSIVLILSLVLISYSAFSQEFCKEDSTYLSIKSAIGEEKPYFVPTPILPSFFDYLKPNFVEIPRPICLNIFFHIVRDDNCNQSNAIDIKLNGTVDDIIDQLNHDYAQYKISFKKIGEDFIDDSRYINMKTHLRYNALFKKNLQINAINIYLVDRAPDRGTGRIPSNTLFIIKSAAISAISSHEIGHCFGLYHTHEASKFSPEEMGQCYHTGDLICDTAPDSNILKEISSSNKPEYYVDINCNYTKEDDFNPDTHNFMSYTNPNCMSRFSYEQISRIRYNILNLPVLQAAISYE